MIYCIHIYIYILIRDYDIYDILLKLSALSPSLSLFIHGFIIIAEWVQPCSFFLVTDDDNFLWLSEIRSTKNAATLFSLSAILLVVLSDLCLTVILLETTRNFSLAELFCIFDSDNVDWCTTFVCLR